VYPPTNKLTAAVITNAMIF